MSHFVKIIEQNDEKAVVAGYGVVFGGVDLDRETFTKDTNFMLDLVPSKPVLYDHSQNKAIGFDILGSVKTVNGDDVGLWIEAELDKSKQYTSAVLALVEEGVIGWSSGSVPHLIRKDSGIIKTWPIVEWSLTATPAEPRTIGIERIKQLSELHPELKSLLPEGDQESAGATDATGENYINVHSTMNYLENQAMSEETKAVEAPAVDLSPIMEAIGGINETVKAFGQRLEKVEEVKSAGVVAPNYNQKTKLGETEESAFAYWAKTGDTGAMRPFKASNDTTMNITTDADGGYLVPTGHYNDIIARRDEMLLANLLNVRRIPGTGTTVNVPVDNEADGEFVSTAESGSFDRDAPAIDQKAMTLVKYTKKIDLTLELMQDEDSRLMGFLADFIARGMAKTHNNLLLTEVAANGTAFKTFASATAIAAGELEDIVGYADLDFYLDDAGSVAWVMRNSTKWDIFSLLGNNRIYANTPIDGAGILGFPVFTSNKAAATAASAKDVYFGNWNYVGWREAPGLTVLRDPYSRAANGEVLLHYYFRTDYAVLQSESVGYGVHPSA